MLITSCEIEHAVNGLSDKNTVVTRRQSENIYEKCKEFPNNTQVSIAIIDRGRTNFIGIKRVNDTIFQSDNQHNVFEIGSITKVFTSTILANAVLEKKVELDDPVNKYLDFTFKDDLSFTLKQLANHTSGLPRVPTNTGIHFNRDTRFRNYDEVKLEDYLTKDLRLQFEPGERTRYSNLGVGILGYTLTKVYNQSFESLIREKIGQKYLMPNTTTEKEKIIDLLVQGQDMDGDIVTNLEIGALIGAGGLYSSVNDLSKFALAHFDVTNTELNLTRKKTYNIDHVHDRGLAWRIIRMDSGKTYFFHNGSTGGYKSFFEIDVENKNGIVILANVSGHSTKNRKIDELGFELMLSLK